MTIIDLVAELMEWAPRWPEQHPAQHLRELPPSRAIAAGDRSGIEIAEGRLRHASKLMRSMRQNDRYFVDERAKAQPR
jgi:hypothetical protein